MQKMEDKMTATEKLNLRKLKLASGGHKDRSNGLCAMEAVAWLANEPHSASPKCACPAITSYVQYLNDYMPKNERQKLKPWLKKIIGTRTTDHATMTKRAMIVADFACRVAAPWALESAGLKDQAEKLRALEPVISSAAAGAARAAAGAARDAAGAASTAAGAAFWKRATPICLDVLKRMIEA